MSRRTRNLFGHLRLMASAILRQKVFHDEPAPVSGVQRYLKSLPAMEFHLVPVVPRLLEPFAGNEGIQRLQQYLSLRLGEETVSELPLLGVDSGYRESFLEAVKTLLEIDAEGVLQFAIDGLNDEVSTAGSENRPFHVWLSLGSSNPGQDPGTHDRDFQSKFELDRSIRLRLCSPLVWTGERISRRAILERSEEYLYRTVYQWMTGGQPITLLDHLRQEVFVATRTGNTRSKLDGRNLQRLIAEFKCSSGSTNRSEILGFFYTGTCSGYKGGSSSQVDCPMPGFHFARHIAGKILAEHLGP